MEAENGMSAFEIDNALPDIHSFGGIR